MSERGFFSVKTLKSRILWATMITIVTAIIASTASAYWLAARQTVTGERDFSSLIQNPLVALNVGDSTMYILQSFGLSENLNILSKEESRTQLSEAGLNTDQPEVRDQIYLAHVDRSRILYPLISAMLGTIFGGHAFLIINLTCLFGIIFIVISLIHQFNAINVSLLALLIISPMFQFTFTALPEMLCYYLLLLYIYYYLCLENKVEENKSLNIKFSLCLIALLLTKPLFVLTFLASLAMYLIRNRRIFLHHALLSVFAGVIWLISNITKLTPEQLLNNNNSLQKVF